MSEQQGDQPTSTDGCSPADAQPQTYDVQAVRRAEELIDTGDYEQGIRQLQAIARASGDESLMQRLVERRVQGFQQINQPITPAPMFEATTLLGDAAALRERLADDGYLLLRDVIPVDRLAELRAQITSILADEGWIEGGARRDQAIALGRPRREGQRAFFQAHDRIVKLEALHALAHEPALVAVMRSVLGDTAFAHPLSIVRLIFPDSPELATPPHQDYPNNQGTARLTASWIPLADCSSDDGALAVLEGSHQYGVLPLGFHLGAGNRRAVLPDDVARLRWVSTDYRAGDVLLFPSLTVHKAMENNSRERMRLSVDFRFQPEGEALTAGCLQPHFQRLGWEDIYAGWESDDLKYYWHNRHYVEVPWNAALHELPPDHVDEAYEQELAFNIVLNRRSQSD